MSKATPRGAVAKFAAGGKPLPKKDLGMIAMTYGNIYVAQVAMGANDTQTVKALRRGRVLRRPEPDHRLQPLHQPRASTCAPGFEQQKAGRRLGRWILYRYDPRRHGQGLNPLQLDSKAPKIPLEEYAYNETRFKMLTQSNPEEAERLLELAQEDVRKRWRCTSSWLAGLQPRNRPSGNGALRMTNRRMTRTVSRLPAPVPERRRPWLT